MKEVHELKTDPEMFDAVVAGKKTYEIRFDDRNYQVGDQLVLRKTRYSGAAMKNGKPLEYLDDHWVIVTHILRGPSYGLKAGWVIMSVRQP